MNYNESVQAYTDYINDHRANVQKAWDILKDKAGGCGYIKNNFIRQQIDENISHHDDSKFSSEEFEPYRKKWYVADGEETDFDEYADAWNHHKAVNPHHWEHWYDTDTHKFKRAPYGESERFVYLVEMICDWIAMGMNGGLDARDWYDENKDIIQIKDNERDMVEDMLTLFYEEIV